MDLAASLPTASEKDCGAQRYSLAAAVPVYWHLLSLDAPTVAVLWAWTLARTVGAAISWSTLAVLAIGTWLIYVADRLLDARAGSSARTLIDLRERHHFHARHRGPLLIAASCAVVPLVWLIFAGMPAAARRDDACVFAVALVYFAAVHLRFARFRFPRELVVGLVFAAACAVPAWSAAAYAHLDLAIVTAFFAVLCWINCTAIHAWEHPNRSRRSLVSLRAILLAIASAAFAVAAWHNPSEMRLAAVIFASAMLFFALNRDVDRNVRRSHEQPHSEKDPSQLALRILADAILLTPLLLLIPWRR